MKYSASILPPNDKWKRIINLIITILTAVASTFAVQSCIERNQGTGFIC